MIKLHGDYLSPETLNTAEELSDYDPAVITLMQRVATESGLVVCGWSADWDIALRRIMASATSTHYPTYWHVFSTPSHQTEKLIAARSAQTLTGDNADDLFDTLKRQVLALEEFHASPQGNDVSAVGAGEDAAPHQDSDTPSAATEEREISPQDCDESAVATVERLLSENRFRIELANYIKRETDGPTARLNAHPLVAITQGSGYGPSNRRAHIVNGA